MEFKIVANIEKPASRRGRNGKASQYPFAQLAKGGSFKMLFGNEDAEAREKISRRIRTASMSYSKTHKDFTFETWTALVTDGAHEADGDGIRVRRLTDADLAKKIAKKASEAGDSGSTIIHANGLATGVSA